MKIDLQIQTTFSDGHNTPTEIVQLAQKNKVSVLAITDHDTTDGIAEAQRAAKKTNVKIIPGIEISTTLRGHRLHVLGYNIDVKNKKLQAFLDDLGEVMKQHFIGLIPAVNARLKKAGRKMLPLGPYKNLSKPAYRMPGLAMYMKEQGVVTKLEDAFQYIVGLKNLILEKDPIEAIELIHAAGGKAVLSHPFAPKISLINVTPDKKEQEKILKSFIDAGLDGIECFTPCHGKSQQTRVMKLAVKYGLGVTGGSDWHGFLDQTGKYILNYIPHYLKDFTGVEVSPKMGKEILAWLNAK